MQLRKLSNLKLKVFLLWVLVVPLSVHAVDDSWELFYAEEEPGLSYLVERTASVYRHKKNRKAGEMHQKLFVQFQMSNTRRKVLEREQYYLEREAPDRELGLSFYDLKRYDVLEKKFPRGDLKEEERYRYFPHVAVSFNSFPIFPDHPVRKGESWSETTSLYISNAAENIPPVTCMITATLVEVIEDKGHKAEIEYFFEGIHEGGKGADWGDHLLGAVDPEIKLHGKGTLTLDLDTGRIIEKKQDYSMRETWTKPMPRDRLSSHIYTDPLEDREFSWSLHARLLDEKEAAQYAPIVEEKIREKEKQEKLYLKNEVPEAPPRGRSEGGTGYDTGIYLPSLCGNRGLRPAGCFSPASETERICSLQIPPGKCGNFLPGQKRRTAARCGSSAAHIPGHYFS